MPSARDPRSPGSEQHTSVSGGEGDRADAAAAGLMERESLEGLPLAESGGSMAPDVTIATRSIRQLICRSNAQQIYEMGISRWYRLDGHDGTNLNLLLIVLCIILRDRNS